MQLPFTAIDWLIFVLYALILVASGWLSSRQSASNSRDYFLTRNSMPMWMVAISTLATTQSAATFLGGPDLGYRGDFTYLFTNLGALVAAAVVARFLIPRFYSQRVTTVYGLLQSRYGPRAKHQAGAMYLLGRVFASGARLYMAAIAVAMIIFNDIEASHVLLAIVLLTAISIIQTYVGGIRSVIQSDILQCAVYLTAAFSAIAVLWWQIPADLPSILQALDNPGASQPSKLALVDFSWDWQKPFNVWSTFTGFVLLFIASFGLDQDVTQRLLTCKNAREGSRALTLSILLTVPIMAVFMGIGMLLYIFYQHPELMGGTLTNRPAGDDVTVFMHYVLHEMPSGLRGLVTIGVVAAALSTLNSSLNSMASVLTEDIYRSWLQRRGIQRPKAHFVTAGRLAMLVIGLMLSAMAILCYYWQQVSDLPLLTFALSVMVFAYSGLLGVFFAAIFTKRGNGTSVTLALLTGFLVILAQQPWMIGLVTGEENPASIAFTWQLCLGTLMSFTICCLGKSAEVTEGTRVTEIRV